MGSHVVDKLLELIGTEARVIEEYRVVGTAIGAQKRCVTLAVPVELAKTKSALVSELRDPSRFYLERTRNFRVDRSLWKPAL